MAVGHVWQGVCSAGGMHDIGAYVAGGVGMCGRGVGMCGRGVGMCDGG